MRKASYAVLVVLLVLMLAACQTRERTGALVGGAAGAVAGETLGDGTTATLLGALGGAAAGYFVGGPLDEQDRQQIAQTLEDEPTGETVYWEDPDTDTRYELTPTNTFTEDGQPCRRFVLEAVGSDAEMEGTACRSADGNWQLVG